MALYYHKMELGIGSAFLLTNNTLPCCLNLCIFVFYYYTDDIVHSGSANDEISHSESCNEEIPHSGSCNEETSSEPLPKLDESISSKSKGMLLTGQNSKPFRANSRYYHVRYMLLAEIFIIVMFNVCVYPWPILITS